MSMQHLVLFTPKYSQTIYACRIDPVMPQKDETIGVHAMNMGSYHLSRALLQQSKDAQTLLGASNAHVRWVAFRPEYV